MPEGTFSHVAAQYMIFCLGLRVLLLFQIENDGSDNVKNKRDMM